MFKARLRLDALEAREVPAFTWAGAVSTDAGDVNNWTPSAQRIDTRRLPAAGDDVYIDASAVDCDGLMVYGGGAFHSLTISGTGGTTSFGAAIATGTYTQQGGAIAQDSAENLTVSDTFTWTGGTLNSTPSNATVYVNGGGSIAPANAGTVSLGSNLIMSGTQPAPKTVTQGGGTIQIIQASAAITINAYCFVATSADALAKNVLGINPESSDSRIFIKPNGKLVVTGPGPYKTNRLIYNQGEFTIQGSAVAYLLAQDPAYSSYEQIDSTSALRLQNGSTLYVSEEARIEGGVVFVMMNSGLAANQQNATIDGKFALGGSATLLFSSPITVGTALTYGTFTVTGDVRWLGGSTYAPSVDCQTAGLANKWIVNGTMTSDNACILAPNLQRGNKALASSVWEVFSAATTAGDPPPSPAGFTLGVFTQNGRKFWRLISPAG